MLAGWGDFTAILMCPGCSPRMSIKSPMVAASPRRLAVPSAVEFEDPIWSGEVRSHQSAEAGTGMEHHHGFLFLTGNPKLDGGSSISL